MIFITNEKPQNPEWSWTDEICHVAALVLYFEQIANVSTKQAWSITYVTFMRLFCVPINCATTTLMLELI